MTLHRSIVKALIHRPMSLADLQAATSVSRPTLRKAIQELIDSHWIRVVGQAETNGGRPAMLFGLDASHYVIVGVHLQLPGVHLVIADLSGNVVDATDLPDKDVPTPFEVMQAIFDYVRRMRESFPDRTILGIGIATPGFIDASTGDILTIGRVQGWQNFPICHRLQSLLEMPVYVANDIDCMAFAEFHHTNGLNDRNLAYVGFDEGVKFSLFLRGQLYKSQLGNAGLIALPLLSVAGMSDPADAKDLLGIVGMSQLFERRVKALPETEQAVYAAILARGARQRVLAILRQPDLELCQQLADQTIMAVAAAVANMIYMIQPDVIVMGGALSQMNGALFTDLRSAISAHLPSLIDNHTTIQQASFSSPSNAAIGAVRHFLQNYLDQVGVDLQPLTHKRVDRSSGDGRLFYPPR